MITLNGAMVTHRLCRFDDADIGELKALCSLQDRALCDDDDDTEKLKEFQSLSRVKAQRMGFLS